MSQSQATDPSQSPSPQGGRLLAVLLAPVFMALVAVSVINVALPAMEESLHASSSGLQWVISGYALAFGVLLVPSGRAGDLSGRRRVLLLGVAVFTVGSLASGLAPNVGVLNASRLVQGIGSGLLNPQSIGLIQQYFRGERRARAFAALGTTVAVATAVGPVIGGLLIKLLGPGLGWRWMFIVNVPIGLATIVLGWRWIPDDRHGRGERPDLDPVGALLLTATILAVMLPFLQRGAGGLIWLSMLVAVGLGWGWLRWESRYKRRGRLPVVDLAIFSNAAFRNGIAIIGVYFLGSTSIWIVVPLYLQMHLQHTAFGASLLGLPSSVAAAISSQVSGRYVLRLGRRLVIAGFVVVLVGLGGTALLAFPVDSGGLPYWWLAVPLTLIGVSQGMTISPNQTLTLGAVDPRFGGVAGGILQLGQRIGAAVGTALIPGVLFGLTESGRPWPLAFGITLALVMALAALALLVSVHDRRRERTAPGGRSG